TVRRERHRIDADGMAGNAKHLEVLFHRPGRRLVRSLNRHQHFLAARYDDLVRHHLDAIRFVLDGDIVATHRHTDALVRLRVDYFHFLAALAENEFDIGTFDVDDDVPLVRLDAVDHAAGSDGRGEYQSRRQP